jgi:hypothetical protein
VNGIATVPSAPIAMQPPVALVGAGAGRRAARLLSAAATGRRPSYASDLAICPARNSSAVTQVELRLRAHSPWSASSCVTAAAHTNGSANSFPSRNVKPVTRPAKRLASATVCLTLEDPACRSRTPLSLKVSIHRYMVSEQMP